MSAGIFESPFVVPVAFAAAWFGVEAAKAVASANRRKLQSTERLAAIEKGMPLPPEPMDEVATKDAAKSPQRRISWLRTVGIVCASSGVGMALFFGVLAAVLQVRAVLSGAAVALIPLVIGIGFLIDARIQKRNWYEERAEAATQPSAYSELPPA